MSSRQPRSRLRQTVSGRRQPVGSEPPRDAAIGERKSQDHRHAAAHTASSNSAASRSFWRKAAECLVPLYLYEPIPGVKLAE